jgi:hypothetical protein
LTSKEMLGTCSDFQIVSDPKAGPPLVLNFDIFPLSGTGTDTTVSKENLMMLSLIYIYKRLCLRKKIRSRKKKEPQNFLLMKLNTKPLKFKCRLADRGWGGVGWWTCARHGYPHLVLYKLTYLNLTISTQPISS